MFTRRTGKVLATSRMILSSVFLVALWLDPKPVHFVASAGFMLLMLYVFWSLVLVIIAWNSWWFDFRLARIVHAIDIAAFIGAAYTTEFGIGDFSSPFIAFAAFLLITATLRWGWTGVTCTALSIVVINGIIGCGLMLMHIDIDINRFGRRQAYMIVLSVMMVWLSAERMLSRAPPLPEPQGTPGERHTRVVAGAVRHARNVLHARGVAIALVGDEEPWAEVLQDRSGIVTEERVGPSPLLDYLALDPAPFLFDLRKSRRIALLPNDQFEAQLGEFDMPLATHCAVPEGIIVPLSHASGSGQLLIWGITDVCVDDLATAVALAREIGLALDRERMASLARSSAVSDIRNALARDLHDSVAQFLAGTLFRLEALRRWLREGNNPDGEINAMKEALRREQAQLRLMVDRLRRGEEGDRRTDLAEEIETLLEEMGHHWHISTRMDIDARPVPVPMQLAYELRQVVREAVANAARHGQCSHVGISLAREADGQLKLSIGDNGKGFPLEAGAPRPRSISERVEALGGRLNISNAGPGARLEIIINTRVAA